MRDDEEEREQAAAGGDPSRRPVGPDTRPSSYGRRDFLQAGAALGLGLGVPLLPGCSEEAPAGLSGTPAVRRRVALGKTGVEVPDIGMGCFALEGDEAVVRHALARGVTHFDTAEGYTEGRSEETLGRVLADQRDQVTITTKVAARSDATAGGLMKRLEGSLSRLRTDYVDFYLNHAVDSLDRVNNPEWGEFVATAKRQGKIRFAGMSGHGPSLVTCLEESLRADALDVILVAYNYIQSPDFIDAAKVWMQGQLGRLDWVSLQPELPDFLLRAREAGVGIMAMKTLRGARSNDLREYETGNATFAQAALRWVLSDGRVDSAMITMRTPESIDEYLGASGYGRPRGDDVALLTRYEMRNRHSQCVQGCGDCLPACPSEVAIPDVLRIGMYDRDYGLTDVARGEYARIARDAAACASCSDTPCLQACPTSVDIASLARGAHRRLAVGPASSNDS